MLKQNFGTIVRLLGLLAILVLGTAQSPAAAEVSQNVDCTGRKGCWSCVVDLPGGGECVFSYCNGRVMTDCL